MKYKRAYKNFLTLILGSLGGKLVALASIPILTRLYEPAEFGVLGLFTSITTILATLVTLRYVIAIPLSKSTVAATNLLAAIAFVGLIVLAIISMVVFIVNQSILDYLGLAGLYEYRSTVVLAIAAAAIYEVASMWCVRSTEFKPLAVSGFYQATVGSLIKLLSGWLGWGTGGLIFGQLMQTSSGLVIISRKPWASVSANVNRISTKRMRAMLRKYASMPIYRLPAQFFYIVSAQAILPLCSKYFGLDAAGKLSLALMALSLPIALISQQAGKVFYSEIARSYDVKKIYQFSKHFTVRLLIIGIVPTTLLALTGEYLFVLVFGEQWAESGVYASTMAIYLLSQFVASPIISYLNIVNKQGLGLVFHLTRAVLVVLIFVAFGAADESLHTTITVYSVFLTLHYFGIVIVILCMMKRKVVHEIAR